MRAPLTALFFLVAVLCAAGEERPAPIVIHAGPMHDGKVNPKLFGGFVELLDDVAPGMWAEMLNDRAFDGVTPLRNGIYYDGSPDICDRKWDANSTWAVDDGQTPLPILHAEAEIGNSGQVENPTAPGSRKLGRRCAKLTASDGAPAILTQSGLAAKSGMRYEFSGYFRTDNPGLKASVSLRTLLPGGQWTTLAVAELPACSEHWQKLRVSMTSTGRSDQTVFEIKAEGEGNLWASRVSLMPADNVHGWRRDVIDTVKEIDPPIIRWGGSLIDPGKYRWKHGIGDRDLRTPFFDSTWGRIDSNDVGIDEFCQFCESVGAQPLICVSFGDGPESAADLVHYCNDGPDSKWGGRRAANGHLAPYHVKHWQIGNEIKGDDPDYLAKIKGFILAIKQADPAAIILGAFPAQKLLDAAGADLAFVCPHLYTPDIAKCEERLASLSQMIDGTPGCEKMKIAVTEWNISAGDWGLGRGRQMTLESALLNARVLNVFLRHCDKVEIATRSNMANSFCGATFGTNPAGVLRRPAHFIMEMYRRHAKPILTGTRRTG